MKARFNRIELRGGIPLAIFSPITPYLDTDGVRVWEFPLDLSSLKARLTALRAAGLNADNEELALAAMGVRSKEK
jgi:hypothetical protein